MPALVNARVRFLYLACCILWGSTWLVIKLGLRDLPPLLFAASRMSLAAALLFPFALRAGLLRLRRLDWLAIGGIGLLQIGIPYALLFAGQQWVPSGLSAVLFATFPVWLLLLARVILPNHLLRPRAVAAAGLGLAGIVVLELPALRGQSLGQGTATGGALIVGAAILIALANLLVRRSLAHREPILIAFVQVLAGAALLVCAAALERGRPPEWTPRALAAVAYLALFGTALTYLALFWVLPRLSVAALGAIPLLDTTVAVSLGALVLREPVGWPLVGGGALVLTGALLAGFVEPEPPGAGLPESSA
jgi:drug/metabolite transporter (DMT)-like permease